MGWLCLLAVLGLVGLATAQKGSVSNIPLEERIHNLQENMLRKPVFKVPAGRKSSDTP